MLAPGSTEGVTIHYQIHGSGATKLLLIPGLACGHAFWQPCISALTTDHDRTPSDNQETGCYDDPAGFQLCTFDNRGVGGSSVPSHKSEYSTTIMAKDALAIMDHLNWQQAHICGHSMGGMIAFKVAAIAPGRVLSLTLISVTGGGFQCLPKMHWKTFAIAYRFIRAKTLEQRVRVDLDTHYTKDYLNALVGDNQRRSILFEEYIANMSSGGMQPKAGLDGHMRACWTHQVKEAEVQRLRDAGILVAVVHGRHDVIAQVSHARSLTHRLRPLARLFELPGGHLVTHQNTEQVMQILLEIVSAAAANVRPRDWSIRKKTAKTEVERLSRIGSYVFVVLILLWILIWFI